MVKDRRSSKIPGHPIALREAGEMGKMRSWEESDGGARPDGRGRWNHIGTGRRNTRSRRRQEKGR